MNFMMEIGVKGVFLSVNPNLSEDEILAYMGIDAGQTHKNIYCFQKAHYTRITSCQIPRLLKAVEGDFLCLLVDKQNRKKSCGISASVLISPQNRWRLFVPENIYFGVFALSDVSRIHISYPMTVEKNVKFNKDSIQWTDPKWDFYWPAHAMDIRKPVELPYYI